MIGRCRLFGAFIEYVKSAMCMMPHLEGAIANSLAILLEYAPHRIRPENIAA